MNAEIIAFARQLKDAGISVNAVVTGYTATDFNEHSGYRSVTQATAGLSGWQNRVRGNLPADSASINSARRGIGYLKPDTTKLISPFRSQRWCEAGTGYTSAYRFRACWLVRLSCAFDRVLVAACQAITFSSPSKSASNKREGRVGSRESSGEHGGL